ncbi:hypothetical protein HK097_005689, partial [Rhizophlyctis rosea]
MNPSSIYHTPEPSPTNTRSSSPIASSITTLRPTSSPCGTPKPYTVTLSLSHATQAHNRTSPSSHSLLSSTSPHHRDPSTRMHSTSTFSQSQSQSPAPLHKHTRKSSYPHRSPKPLPPFTTKKEKKRQGYITLDVYSIYATDPEALLY